MRAPTRTRATAAVLAVAAALGGATAIAVSGASAAGKPGAGKPTIVIGDKNFTEENILGALYAQALEAKGYKVTLKDNIGSSEIIWKAFTSEQIGVFPEYTGTLLTAIADDTRNPTSAVQAYQEAKAFVSTHGATLLSATPFYDSDVLATKPAYAAKNHLKSVGDLKKLGSSVRLGAAPEFATRFEGLLGLEQEYGVKPTFVPLAIGLTYNALDSGQVDVGDVFTTDGQLVHGKYTLLTDPKGVFGYQNVAPVVNTKVLSAEGPAFTSTLNAVDALLTTKAVQALNYAVSIEKLTPAQVAGEFLKANHLA